MSTSCFGFETVDPVKPLINMHSCSYSAKYLQSVRLGCDDKTGNDKLDDKDLFMSFLMPLDRARIIT